MELRCTGGKLHGVLLEHEGLIEFKCRSIRCGANSDTTVMHYFNSQTGELVSTKKYSDPKRLFKAKKEVRQDAFDSNSASVRA